MHESLSGKILTAVRSESFREGLAEALLELCRIDTTPKADIPAMRHAESACFDLIRAKLSAIPFAGAKLQRRPIPPSIAEHPSYTAPYFTRTPERPDGLPPEEVYRGRSNLVFLVEGDGEPGAALNAHVDVVAPFFPPRREGGALFGRGACDDKGNAVAILGALQALGSALAETGARPPRSLVAMFAVEEETGGNGSLALALDEELRRHYASIVVAECTSGRVHPANRGAVWHQIELDFGAENLEVCAFVVESLDEEGKALREESLHPLFPHRPVQTCHGILGPFGEHPSRVCGEVAFRVRFPAAPSPEAQAFVRECIHKGFRESLSAQNEQEPLSPPGGGRGDGEGAVAASLPAAQGTSRSTPLECEAVSPHSLASGPSHGGVAFSMCCRNRDCVVRVSGATGHMGGAGSAGSAVALAAAAVRALVRAKGELRRLSGGDAAIELEGQEPGSVLTLEGGQGFLPTHRMAEVKQRMADAARRGVGRHPRFAGRREAAGRGLRVSFGKLHNDAFACDPDSPQMRHAVQAARAADLWDGQPAIGWDVSCDARLFAAECPGMPVLTAGAGDLAVAHSDEESVEIAELAKASGFFALYLLHESGLSPDFAAEG